MFQTVPNSQPHNICQYLHSDGAGGTGCDTWPASQRHDLTTAGHAAQFVHLHRGSAKEVICHMYMDQ